MYFPTSIHLHMRRPGIWVMAMSALLGATCVLLADYLPFDRISFYLPLLSAGLFFRNNPYQLPGWKYPLMAAASILLGCWIPVQTFYYFSAALCLICLLELRFGRQSPLVGLALLSAAPVTSYLVDVFTFPIRLSLTAGAANILRWLDPRACAEGTSIVYQGTRFNIDTGCMGLYMFLVAVQIGLFLLSVQVRKNECVVKRIPMLLFFFALFLLTIVANFLRILLLITLNCPAGTARHQWVGLICFTAYVLIPATYLIRRFFKSSPSSEELRVSATRGWVPAGLYVILLVGLLIQGMLLKTSNNDFLSAQRVLDKFQPVDLCEASPGVQQFHSRGALVYVKQVRGFFDTDHQPMMCWQGTGYEFVQTSLHSVGSQHCYMGEMRRGNQVLYSAWWYDNGYQQTSSAWDWRWRMVKGEAPYALVNVTCESRNELIDFLDNYFSAKTF